MPTRSDARPKRGESACAICGGTGFRIVRTEDDGGRVMEKATTCECRLQSRSERLLDLAGIPPRYRHCELSNFDHEGPFASLAPAFLHASQFVTEYPLEEKGLLVIGPIGVGKTHLAVGILKALILQKGVRCLFCDCRELLKQIQDSFNPSVQATELSVLQPVFDAEVLLLDELGAATPTASEWITEQLQFILNTRYNSAKTTIFTTNYRNLPPGGAGQERVGRPESYSPAALANRERTLGDRIGERMRSRLHEMCRIINLQGDDYRMKYRGARCD